MKITKDDLEMADDIYAASLTELPSIHRLTIWSLAALFVCFFVWAYFAELDRVTRGEGKVIPSTQMQIIQSLDGGVLQELYVKEGMSVKKGQLLARIDDTRFRSDMAQQNKEVDALRADIIRLQTELTSILVTDVPNWKLQINISKQRLKFPDDLNRNSPKLVLYQQEEYLGRLNNLENKVAIQGHQIIQRQQEINDQNSKIETLKVSLELLERELTLTRPLAEKNIVPEVDLLRLKRTFNDAEGELKSLRTIKSKQQSAFEEAVLKRREEVLNFRADAREQLNEFQSKYSRITEAQVGVQDKVKKALIRSPVVGKINTVHINTLGGVVKPGQALLEIVPTEDKLLIEAKILPKDIGFIHIGLPALVKITAYDFTRYGGLTGIVEHISADTTQDEEGNIFYIIRIKTKNSKIHSKDKKDMPIIPGMLTSVDVIMSKRSVLEYILNPILRAKDMALREN
jgi:adhesin transport system membrane fusion protein